MTTPLKPSLSLDAAAATTWDAIIIGAGVAGASCAYLLSCAGVRTLLVDKAQFPRAKVCGCCINSSAIHSLEAMGLSDVLTSCGAIPLTNVKLMARHRQAIVAATLGVSLSRSAMDAAIISRAVERGVSFLPEVMAQVENVEQDGRIVTLRRGEQQVRVSAWVVIAADGLGGRSLDSSEAKQVTINAHSHMGIATIMSAAPTICEKHQVLMACSSAGYVGLVRLEDDQLNIACALAPAFIKEQGGPAGAVIATLAGADSALCDALAPSLKQALWMGTGLLTRRRSIPAAERIFVLGDAAGYVEPITGEGMAWALRGAALLAPIAQSAAKNWHESHAAKWTQLHQSLITKRQLSCRVVSSILRRPLLTRCMLSFAKLWPRIAARCIERMHAPLRIGERT